jgi:ankyrin repeat protein
MKWVWPLVILLLTLTFALSSAAAADLNGDLLKAAGKDKEQVDKVRKLLERGANVNAQDKEGRTALHLSALRDHPETVAVLLAHRVDVNACDKAGDTALQLAARWDHAKIVSMLLEAGARIFIPVSPKNPSERMLAGLPLRLYEAAAKGDLVLLKSLLRSEVPLDVALQGKSDTPLLAACANGQLEAAKALLAAGANASKLSKDGRTALHLAASTGSLPLVELLAHTSIDLNAQDSSKMSAADIAVAARSLPVLSFLLDRGVSLSDRDKALHWAMEMNNRALAERLITTAPTMTSNDFLVAVSLGLTDSTRRYLNVGNKPPPLALVLAARNGDVSLCEVLLNNGANVNGIPDDDSVVTPLVAALRGRHPDVARLLLSRGADPGIPPSGASAPASLARSAGYDDITKAIDDTIRARTARLKERMHSLRRVRLSVKVPRMTKVTSRGNDRIFTIDLTEGAKTTDEHWTALVRRAVEDAVSSFGIVLVDTGQDADLNVTFHGYSAYSPNIFEPTSTVLFSAVVVLNVPDLGPLHKYEWTVTFLSRQDKNNYAKYFGSSGEANEAVILADFRDVVRADLNGVLPPPALKASPLPKVAPSPRKRTQPRSRPQRWTSAYDDRSRRELDQVHARPLNA